jgi:ABC-type nickel/cobalt efflux system permease component RcnA
MGNFSVNHYTQISIQEDRIEILYLVDMAEIPAYQEIQQAGIVARQGDPSLAAHLPAKGASLGGNLVVEANGARLALNLVSQQIIFPAGAGGLPTLKMAFVYRAALPALATGAVARLRFRDLNFPGRSGWKEIIVDAPVNALVSSSVSGHDRSNRLSNYPVDLLNSPPQDLEAEVTFRPTVLASSRHRTPKSKITAPTALSPAATRKASLADPSEEKVTANTPPPMKLQATRGTTPHNAFTELISAKHLSLWFLVVASAIAAGLGALHALEPGHGKTIVAAYLVGSRGTAKHAFLLGLIVTASHTAGVYLLGAITLYAQRYILPERVYPFLGVLSGILIAGMGGYLFLERCLGTDFAHSHEYTSSTSGKPARNVGPARTVTSRLFLLGITGGMIPCPGALVVLLSAVALHRTGLGLFLIVAFSVGLAAVLIAMGVTAVYARRVLSKRRWDGPLVHRWLPMTSATIITILGIGITMRALVAAGIVQVRL